MRKAAIALPLGIAVGTGFGPTQSNSVVSFYGATAEPSITSWSDTSIVAVVPAGTTSGNVSVTVADLHGY